jgi:hypothetical protein
MKDELTANRIEPNTDAPTNANTEMRASSELE